MFLPVDGEAFNDSIVTALKCAPDMEFRKEDDPRPASQKTNKLGLPVWVVTVSYEHAERDYEPENCEVKVASVGDPGIVVGPIRFGGLSFRTWNMNGKKGLAISADSFTQEPRPSSMRKTDPPPSASPATGSKAA